MLAVGLQQQLGLALGQAVQLLQGQAVQALVCFAHWLGCLWWLSSAVLQLGLLLLQAPHLLWLLRL